MMQLRRTLLTQHQPTPSTGSFVMEQNAQQQYAIIPGIECSQEGMHIVGTGVAIQTHIGEVSFQERTYPVRCGILRWGDKPGQRAYLLGSTFLEMDGERFPLLDQPGTAQNAVFSDDTIPESILNRMGICEVPNEIGRGSLEEVA